MQTFVRDLVFALRSLRQHPAFALTAVLTLALGIGASTAIFSVVNAVLLRPLPYAEAERLVLIWGDMRARNVTDFPFSPPNFLDLKQQSTTLAPNPLPSLQRTPRQRRPRRRQTPEVAERLPQPRDQSHHHRRLHRRPCRRSRRQACSPAQRPRSQQATTPRRSARSPR